MTSQELQKEYEKLLREIIDDMPIEECGVYQVSNTMQALKYLFSFLCSNDVKPDEITTNIIKSFAKEKHLSGVTETTILFYFGNIRKYFLDRKNRKISQNVEDDSLLEWIEKWNQEGFTRGSRPSKRPEVEICYTGHVTQLKSVHKILHPRG